MGSCLQEQSDSCSTVTLQDTNTTSTTTSDPKMAPKSTELYTTSFTPTHVTITHNNSKDLNSVADTIFSRKAIQMSHAFWTDNVLTLSSHRKQQLGVQLFAHMFHQMPQCRKLFLQKDIAVTSQRFLGMIEWLIIQLYMTNGPIWSTLQPVGLLHRKCGISEEYYLPMLEALHKAFDEQFPRNYTLRVRVCIENLFMNASKILTGQEIKTLFPERVCAFENLEFLVSLDACLAHTIGRGYLEKYLEQTFWSEYVMFLRCFDAMKQSQDTHKKYVMAKEIYNTHFDDGGRNPIEFTNAQYLNDVIEFKKELDRYQELSSSDIQQALDDTFVSSIDTIYADVKLMMEERSWDRFCTEMHSIKTYTQSKQ